MENVKNIGSEDDPFDEDNEDYLVPEEYSIEDREMPEDADTEPCSICDGTGKDPMGGFSDFECPNCEGEGVVVKEEEDTEILYDHDSED